MKTEEDPLIQSWERLWLRAGSGLRSPLRVLAWIFVGIAGLFLGFYLWGLSLPAMLVQRQDISCGLPQAKAFDLLRNVSAYPKWRRDVRHVEVLPASGFHANKTQKQGEKNPAIVSGLSQAEKQRIDRMPMVSSTLPHGPKMKSKAPKPSFYYREYYTDKKFFFYRVYVKDQEIVFELLPRGIEAARASHALATNFRGKMLVRIEGLPSQKGGMQSRVRFTEESYYPNPFRRSIAGLAAGRRIKRYAEDLKKVCQ